MLEKVPADQVAVSVRNPDKAEALKAFGVDVRYGDFEQPETLVAAFSGIDRLLIVSSSEVRLGGDEIRLRQHLNAVAAAKRANVKFIAFTSAPNARGSEFFLAPVYKATEAAILDLCRDYERCRSARSLPSDACKYTKRNS